MKSRRETRAWARGSGALRDVIRKWHQAHRVQRVIMRHTITQSSSESRAPQLQLRTTIPDLRYHEDQRIKRPVSVTDPFVSERTSFSLKFSPKKLTSQPAILDNATASSPQWYSLPIIPFPTIYLKRGIRSDFWFSEEQGLIQFSFAWEKSDPTSRWHASASVFVHDGVRS